MEELKQTLARCKGRWMRLEDALPDAWPADLQAIRAKVPSDSELEFHAVTDAVRCKGPLTLASNDPDGILDALRCVYPAPLKAPDIRSCYATADADLRTLARDGRVVVVQRTALSIDRIDEALDHTKLEHLKQLFTRNSRDSADLVVVLKHMRLKWPHMQPSECKPFLQALTKSRIIQRSKSARNGKAENKWHLARQQSDVVYWRLPAEQRAALAVASVAAAWANAQGEQKSPVTPTRTDDMRTRLLKLELPVIRELTISSPSPTSASPSTPGGKKRKLQLPRPLATKLVHKTELDAISKAIASITGTKCDLMMEL
jgi:hypothetical protein